MGLLSLRRGWDAHDRARLGLVWLLTFALATLIAFGSVYLTRADERVAAIWPLNALLLAVMVGASRRIRAGLVVAGVLGHLVANLLNGDSLPAAALLSTANGLELGVLVAASAGINRARLAQGATILRMVAYALGACLASTLVARLGLAFTSSGATGFQLTLWFFAHFLGLLLFFPLAWAARDAVRMGADRRAIGEAWPELALVVIASVLIFAQSTYSLLFVVPPLMVLLAFRRSFLAAVVGLTLMAATAFWFTLHGIGPITSLNASLQSQIVFLQVFVGVNTLTTLLMSAAISEGRRSEQSLKVARERLRHRLAEEQLLLRQAALAEDMSGVGYWSADPRSGETFWSPQVFRIRGLDPGSYRPKTDDAFAAYVEEDRDRIELLLADAVAHGESCSFEADLVRSDGDIRRVRAVADCTLDAAGEVTRMFGVIQDVTDDYRRLEAIRQQQELYRLLADNASDLITRYSPDGQFTYLSPALSRMLGYEPDELIGRRTYDVLLTEDVDQLHADFDEGLKSGLPFSVQYRARHKDGSVRVLEARPSPDRDGDGKIVGFFDVVRDVTEREHREQELAIARREAEEAARVKADFLSNMSHEIRTPLNAVLGFANLLHQTRLNVEQTRFADRIAGAGEALLSVVNDILDFSRLEAGKVEIQNEPYSLVGQLETTADIVRAAYPGIAGRLSIAVDPAVPELSLGDQHRVAQILTNLMGNAAKFAEGGSVAVTVGVSNDSVEIRVCDDGPGIEADRLNSVFEAFSQADGSIARKFGGTGLGLPISRRLARLMGGDVWLESELGMGATAVLTLPNRPTERRQVARERPTSAGDIAGLRVMVVDDAELNRELIDISLKRQDCKPSLFSGAAEALAALTVRPDDFDVILMDVQMPDIDGLEATRRIRNMDGRAARLPIIALTANVMAQQVRDCRRAGMDDHVGKPIDFTLLLRKLATLSRRRKPRAVVQPSGAGVAGALDDLSRRYQAHMAEVADQLAALLDAPDSRAEIAGLSHGVAGTAGSLGFPEASTAAFQAEAAAKAGDAASAKELRTAVEGLIQALRVSAGTMSSDT